MILPGTDGRNRDRTGSNEIVQEYGTPDNLKKHKRFSGAEISLFPAIWGREEAP
jgi:hypothetical protein